MNLRNPLDVIDLKVFGIFGIKADTGNPYLDAAIVLAVLIIVLAFVAWMRTKAKSRRPIQKGPPRNPKGTSGD